MRVTDDERREAASNLRLLEPSVFDEGEFYDSWEVLDAIGVASDDGAWYEAAGVRRLADLIEPEPERTCRPVCPQRVGQNGVLYKMFHRCSLCGHDLPYEAEKGHCGFCPACGARAVRG